MKIVGFDPGTVATGFGIVVFAEGGFRLVSCGVWRPRARLSLAEKLEFLFGAAEQLLAEAHPDAASIETVFSARNVASSIKLSHARGVLLAAASRSGVPVFEYQPRLVKKALVGYGNAEKEQVRAMVLTLLARQRERVPLDAADALALAICHAHACGPLRPETRVSGPKSQV